MQLVHLCTLLLISSVLSLPVADRDLDKEFEEWKKKHNKVYISPEEEAERRAIWEESRKRVEAHNKEADQGLHTYWTGLNQFSDQKKEERRGCVPPLPPIEPMMPLLPLLPLPIPEDTTSHNTTSHNTTSHNTTSHNTTSHNTTSHNTTTVAGEKQFNATSFR